MSDKELPFKSIKITLSSEALARLDYIVKQASFRSYSSGVEECIRAIYDLVQEVEAVVGANEQPITTPTIDEVTRAFERIGMRMTRFTGRSIVPKSKAKSK